MDGQDDLVPIVRALGGLLAIVALLSLMILSFLDRGEPLAQTTFIRLVSLIGALLALDRFGRKWSDDD